MLELKTILLVEDNPQDVELTIRAFEEHKLGNSIAVAGDGVEALEYLCCEGAYADRKQINPVLILLDIKMPRLDGIEVLKAIRESESLRLIPVVMLTSSREEPDLKRCYELGVNAYVVKPVAFNEFVEAVRHIGVFWGLLNEVP